MLLHRLRAAACLGGLEIAVLLAAHVAAAATPVHLPDRAEALAAVMQGHRVIILGEVHDNGIQHALRAAALRSLIEGGARPAIALEQFDRDRQAAIDAARKARPRDADYLIAQARGASSWNWALYKPFVALALEYDLPIVAANLSRQDAMQVATGATPAGFDVPATFLRAHEEIIAEGHCNLLPAPALPGMARAQIARDRALAEAIAPYAARGVVLLTGNGHARTDIGVPHWLSSEARATLVSIALLERPADGAPDASPSAYDAYLLTDAVKRPDPCEELARRMKPKS
jgi:uncharacterized iron-regulated protein